MKKALNIIFVINFALCSSTDLLPESIYNDEDMLEKVETFVNALMNEYIHNYILHVHFDDVGFDLVQRIFERNQLNPNVTDNLNLEYILKIFHNYKTKLYVEDKNYKPYSLHFIFLKNMSHFDDLFQNYASKVDQAVFICWYDFGLCFNEVFNKSANKYSFNYDSIKNSEFIRSIFSTFVIEITVDVINFYELCFYCGSSVREPEEKNSYGMDNDLAATARDIMSLVKNNWFMDNFYRGHEFIVGIPHMYVDYACKISNGSTGDNCRYSLHPEMVVLKEISNQLNCTYKFNYIDTHNGVIQAVRNKTVDWGVGSVSITSKRMNLVAFTRYIEEDKQRLVYSAQKVAFTKEVYQLLHVFSWQSWMALIVSIVIQSYVMYSLNYLRLSDRQSFKEYIWNIGYYLVDQPINKNILKLCKWSLICWILSNICISTIYKANLTSIRMKPPKEVPKTMEQLLNNGYEALMLEDELLFILELINKSSDPILQKLEKNMASLEDICHILHILLNGKNFIVDQEEFLKYSIDTGCQGILTVEEILRYKVATDVLFPSYLAWPVRRESPYIYDIDSRLQRITESGLTLKWRNNFEQHQYKTPIYFTGTKINYKSTGLRKRFYGYFLVLAAGLLMATACFIMELFSYSL